MLRYYQYGITSIYSFAILSSWDRIIEGDDARKLKMLSISFVTISIIAV
jgi:hypothetical protein